jgi:hypothetical protein
MENGSLTITILHRLPGRIRVHLSSPPKAWEKMAAAISSHGGIKNIFYSPVSKTVLLTYDPSAISQEEFLIRQAVLISSDYGMVPVNITEPAQKEELSPSVYVSAALLGVGLLSGIVPRLSARKRLLHIIAAAGTAGAVLEHGYREYQERGNFDPEVLSVIYLFTSLLRGAGLTAPIITWLASFGRHIFGRRNVSLVVNPVLMPGSSSSRPTYEVTVRENIQQHGLSSFLRFIPQILADAVSGGSIGRDRLIDQIKEVSTAHNSILEGFGNYKKGISLRVM